jgi:hypothetical protein
VTMTAISRALKSAGLMPGETPAEAQIAAGPVALSHDASAPLTLARMISGRGEVTAMDDERLLDCRAEHEQEILKVQSRVEVEKLHDEVDQGKVRRLRKSLQYLNLHLRWLREEAAYRDAKRKSEQNAQAQQAAAERAKERRQHAQKNLEVQREVQREAQRVRLERQERHAAVHDRDFEVFKRLVRDKIGEEAYSELWVEVGRLTAGAR